MNLKKRLERLLPSFARPQGEDLGLTRGGQGMEEKNDDSGDGDHAPEEPRLRPRRRKFKRSAPSPPNHPARQDGNSPQHQAVIPFKGSREKQTSGILAAKGIKHGGEH
jgi:hypothetical protein